MSVIAELACGCAIQVQTMMVRALPDERCDVHSGQWFNVLRYWRDEWHTSCNVCSFGRSHGLARQYADNAAARHMARYAHHQVTISFYNSAPKRVKDRVAAPLTLLTYPSDPMDQPLPPF